MTLEYFLKQYNKSMSQYEINDIQDNNIRKIKRKYWDMKYKAFKNENDISDKDLSDYYDYINNKEKEELESYYYKNVKQD